MEKSTERALLRAIARMIGAKRPGTPGIVVGIGDDAAVLRPPPGCDLVMTVDSLVEGRHFERTWLTGFELGRRLAAVNLSDIAAMGAKPLYGLLSLALPADVEVAFVKAIERGVRDQLAVFGAAIVGGNVSGIDGPLVCNLTLVGSCSRGRVWKRTARAGDAVVVVGALGEARAGLEILMGSVRGGGRLVRAFKKPAPLLDVVRLLAREKSVHGAIDVSDGFSTDLIHMCEVGSVGVEVDAARLPIGSTLERHCRREGREPLEYVLNGGEDYALILSVAWRGADRVVARLKQTLGAPVDVVGRFVRCKGDYRLVEVGGGRVRLTDGGWDHLKS